MADRHAVYPLRFLTKEICNFAQVSNLKITGVLKQCTIEIAINLDLPQYGIGSRSNRSAQRPGCLGGIDAAQRNRSKTLDG